MERLEALDRATAEFDAALRRVGPDDWSRPSTNPGWSVWDLVNHVVGGNVRYVVLLTGAPTAEVERLRDVDHVGANPVDAFRETSDRVRAAFAEPGVLEQVVHHRLGDRSGSDLLTMRILEHALHGWDLARSVNLSVELDPKVVAAALHAIADDPSLLVRSGYPEPAEDAVTGADAADPARRLLTLTGRA